MFFDAKLKAEIFLRQIYPTILKAWRLLLDRDGSNVVGWEEFAAAAKRLNFHGDLPGAWRFFDQEGGDGEVDGAMEIWEIVVR